MVDLYGMEAVTAWLEGKPPPSSEYTDAMTDPDSPYFDEEAHRRKWDPETWGMDPAVQGAMRMDEAQFQPGMMPSFGGMGPTEGVTP